jgi:excisionase family DNA binding protein
MPLAPRIHSRPILPTPDAVAMAQHLTQSGAQSGVEVAVPLLFTDPATGQPRKLPAPLAEALHQVLSALARNQAISIVPTDVELTTNQAADILNVSRSYVIQAVERGILPCRLVGSHRRLALPDVLTLRETMTVRARRGLDDLAKLDTALGLDD